MSMEGELNFFLRIQIKQCQDGIFINQGKYAKELLKKYKIDEVKHATNLMVLNTKLNLDHSCKSVSAKVYRGVIGLLLYWTASRPDFMFGIWLCVRFQSTSKQSHLTGVKRILRYLTSTKEICDIPNMKISISLVTQMQTTLYIR